VVPCIDEKSQVQALQWTGPSWGLPDLRGRLSPSVVTAR
jgi:hypothetical protein